jgi:glycine/D-amino acid oxidase-like deaminating enzyme
VSSWWLTEDPAPEFAAAGRGPVDVEVVGAGMTGISAALTLARAGLRVRVRDGRRVAEGASGRNGGFALRGGAMSYDRAREQLGRERAAAYWRATEAALDRLAALGGDALRRVGSLRLADDEAERDELRLEHDALLVDGFDAEWREGVHRGRFPAAIFHPRDGATQPARLVRRLAQHAADAGVELVEGARVRSLDELDAPHVVVATDGYPSGLLGALGDAIVPTRGQVLVTEPLGERLFECPHYSRHGFDYWQQTPDGRIVAGGFRDHAFDDEWTADEETTPLIQDALESFVAELVGRRVRIEQRWAGIFGSVRDLLPLAGRVDDRVWVSAGYSGHGNVVGFLCGELVARAILGDEDELLSLFDPARFSDVELRQV